MADRIAVLVDGEVVQFGTPEELWQRPNHPFVAATIADLQPLKGRIEGTQCVTAFGALPLRLLALQPLTLQKAHPYRWRAAEQFDR